MSKISNILATTDFSAPARHAVMRAAMLASEIGAHLSLIHVVNLSLMETLHRLLGQSGDTLARQMVDEAKDKVRQLAATLEQRFGLSADERVATGNVQQEIIAHADRRAVDLIVMGARGAGFMREMLLGSTTERVLKKTIRPLLVVKQMAHEPYRGVLAPVDFSPRSIASLELAHMVAPKAEFILLNAFEAPFEGKLHYAGVNDFEIAELHKASKREAIDRMDQLVVQSNVPAGQLKRLVLPGSPTNCILEQEQEQDCDLIVIGKHGYGALEEFMMGSVTKHVLNLSNCDLLVADRSVA